MDTNKPWDGILTDQPVSTAEQLCNKRDIVTPAQNVEKPRDARKTKVLYRQLPLIEDIAEQQRKCSHTLQIGNNTIVCRDCGALWLD